MLPGVKPACTRYDLQRYVTRRPCFNINYSSLHACSYVCRCRSIEFIFDSWLRSFLSFAYLAYLKFIRFLVYDLIVDQ